MTRKHPSYIDQGLATDLMDNQYRFLSYKEVPPNLFTSCLSNSSVTSEFKGCWNEFPKKPTVLYLINTKTKITENAPVIMQIVLNRPSSSGKNETPGTREEFYNYARTEASVRMGCGKNELTHKAAS